MAWPYVPGFPAALRPAPMAGSTPDRVLPPLGSLGSRDTWVGTQGSAALCQESELPHEACLVPLPEKAGVALPNHLKHVDSSGLQAGWRN